jgi:uncharacterized protein
MRNFIGILCLLALVSCKNNPEAVQIKFKTMMIKSYGEVEVLPDMASFTINLSCLDKSIKDSKKCLVVKSNELNSTLQSFGISKDDILTSSVDLNKSYAWTNNSSVFEGYRSSITVFVTVRNIEKLDEIYTDLLENSNLELGGLIYSHSKPDSLKNEAYVDALEKSGILADRLLEKLPGSGKEILKIGNVQISSSLPETKEFMQEEAREDMNVKLVSGEKSVAISKGTVKVTATLYVEYLIK